MKKLSPAEALENPAYKESLAELLYQLADDDFILAYRGSEWLGLAPHIEEDVAFSSINQDTMGHAAMYYQLLEDLGEGSVDALAHGRTAAQRRNAVLLEMANGPGDYLSEPDYDWAFAVVRHYFYTAAKKIKINSLKNSSYQPLCETAVKISMELYYHQLHWKTWFEQLMLAGGEARSRMEQAIVIVMDDFGGVLSLGAKGAEITRHGLIDSKEILQKRWNEAMKPAFDFVNLSIPIHFAMKHGDGRNGDHTDDLARAISTLGEVYHFDPAASW
ncbi:1,2-phenylacetyl-CoA epoxidase subunit PaaC [Bacillus sp. V3-13]|uniref:1,2-phenylacetyl-CoA epoxidase subunit PaaC n=1 Tax=Bacillus sp. V3-13 TaxID=2053728 RepID=UPI0021528499|nr:1,2-phenylacetyl-CoA epoxidase subunit PaaC [Bacillus sp. V3-13]